ncbi:hypothetical protein CDL12_20655 [Handroanthus impetiginosus]|uniref:SHSP domain-containing protein n=1 Tax=Handroanthus impetiginosus TaxID=429701 RepID=A0A2G9GNJ1_9LAMI|nr:hypothetical protein CDL12_20655 [Handroanthus impetiginosus]
MDKRINPRDMVFEYMVPSSSWSEDTDCHYLRIDLPGFNMEEMRLRADKYGHIIVSGERQVNDNKIIHFEQLFKVPENSDIEETSAIFEDDRTYCVTIPKNVVPDQDRASEVQNSTSVYNSNNNNLSRKNDETVHNNEEEESHNEKKTSFVNKMSNTSSRNNEDDEEKEFRDAKSSFYRTPVLAVVVIVLLVAVFVPLVLGLRSH